MESVNVPEPRVKVWRPQGFEGVEIELFENLPEFHVPLYFMDGFYEITVARGPEFKLHYMKANHRFNPNEDLFLIQQPGGTVSAASLNSEPLTARTLRLYPKIMSCVQDAFELSTNTPFFPSTSSAEQLNAALAKLANETVTAFDEGASSLECEFRLLSLLHAVLKHCSDSPPPEVELGQEHKAVSVVKEVLHAHPELDITLDDLGSVTKLSKYHLMRVFQREVGVSPHNYQTGLRVNRAKDRLVQGAEIVDVALELNFSDQAHFTRTFKTYTQTTPGKFRRDSLTS